MKAQLISIYNYQSSVGSCKLYYYKLLFIFEMDLLFCLQVIYDLLEKSSGDLEIREDPDQRIMVAGLKRIKVFQEHQWRIQLLIHLLFTFNYALKNCCYL